MEVKFINRPQLEPFSTDGDDELWQLVSDFYVEVDGLPFTVPKDFLTDGASIPRILWRVCGHPLSTKRLPIAVFHDWLYWQGRPFSRDQADEIYRDGLLALGFPKWKANLEYYALRWFGGAHFNEGDKET